MGAVHLFHLLLNILLPPPSHPVFFLLGEKWRALRRGEGCEWWLQRIQAKKGFTIRAPCPGCWSVQQALRPLGPLSVCRSVGRGASFGQRRSKTLWLEPCCRVEGILLADLKEKQQKRRKKRIHLTFGEIHQKNHRSLREPEENYHTTLFTLVLRGLFSQV